MKIYGDERPGEARYSPAESHRCEHEEDLRIAG